jgi:hypothetical protein
MMFRKANLAELMREELPPIAYQKRLCYRTDYDEVVALYRLINKTIFNNKLIMPEIEVMPRCRKYWGMCYGSLTMPTKSKSYCKIRLMDKWYCRQWLINVLAHEMCHQYQWDIEGMKRLNKGKEPIMSHGPSFFIFREKLKKHGICLKGAHSKRKWFLYQNLFKC